MQHCGKCGEYNAVDSTFCGQCGTRLNNRCLDCGFQNLMQQKFCGNCGKQLQEDNTLPHSARHYGNTGHTQPPTAFNPPRPTAPNPMAPVGWPMTSTSPTIAPSQQPQAPPLPAIQSQFAPSQAKTPAGERLPEYALLSLEFAEWDQALSQNAATPEGMNAQLQEYMTLLEQHFMLFGGDASPSRLGVLFVSFPSAGGLTPSLVQAVEACLPLLPEEFVFGASTLKLRVGLTVETATDRDPLGSTAERTFGLPGTLNISEIAYQHLQARYAAQSVGPVDMGGGTLVRVYRLPLLHGETLTEPQHAVPVTPATSAHSTDSFNSDLFTQDDLSDLWDNTHPGSSATNSWQVDSDAFPEADTQQWPTFSPVQQSSSQEPSPALQSAAEEIPFLPDFESPLDAIYGPLPPAPQKPAPSLEAVSVPPITITPQTPLHPLLPTISDVLPPVPQTVLIQPQTPIPPASFPALPLPQAGSQQSPEFWQPPAQENVLPPLVTTQPDPMDFLFPSTVPSPIAPPMIPGTPISTIPQTLPPELLFTPATPLPGNSNLLTGGPPLTSIPAPLDPEALWQTSFDPQQPDALTLPEMPLQPTTTSPELAFESVFPAPEQPSVILPQGTPVSVSSPAWPIDDTNTALTPAAPSSLAQRMAPAPAQNSEPGATVSPSGRKLWPIEIEAGVLYPDKVQDTEAPAPAITGAPQATSNPDAVLHEARLPQQPSMPPLTIPTEHHAPVPEADWPIMAAQAIPEAPEDWRQYAAPEASHPLPSGEPRETGFAAHVIEPFPAVTTEEADPASSETPVESQWMQTSPVESQPSAPVLPSLPEAQMLNPMPPQAETGTATDEPFPYAYEAPTLLKQATPRQANIPYSAAHNALGTELESFLTNAATHPNPQSMAICANDGLGKSNLISLVRNQIDPENDRAIWLGGSNCRMFADGTYPLFYWLELMQNMLSLSLEGQNSQEVYSLIDQFLGHVSNGDIVPEERAFLADLLSAKRPRPLSADADRLIGRLEYFLIYLLGKLAQKRPVIIVVEDLMFADNNTLRLLGGILQGLGPLGGAIYFILTQTPDCYADGPLLSIFQQSGLKEMVISDLDGQEALTFLNDGPLGGNLSSFPQELIDALLAHARGIPLYMEEALRLLHLEEIITVDPNSQRFVMQRPVSDAHQLIPADPFEVAQKRLHYLDEQSLYTLQLASVLGEKFTLNLLLALAQCPEEAINECLGILFNHGYLIPDAPNTARFRHGFLWQVVYSTMDPELRQSMHQLVSGTLENDLGQGRSVNPMLIAFHSERGNLLNRALQYWELAGIYASQLGDIETMNATMLRAVSLMEHLTDGPLAHEELAVKTAENLGLWNAEAYPAFAISLLNWCYPHITADASTLGRRVEMLTTQATAYEQEGDITQALAKLQQALTLVPARQYPQEAASLNIRCLEALYTLGKLEQARTLLWDHIEPALANESLNPGALSEFGMSGLQARLIQAQIMLAQCDTSVIPLLTHSIATAERSQLDGLAVALKLVEGQAMIRQGRYEDCNHGADALLETIEQMEDGNWFLAQWGLLAIVYHCVQEDWTSASQLILTVIAKSEAVKDHHTWIVAQIYAGYITGKSGNIQEGRKVIEQALELAAEHRFASAALLGWRLLADFELGLGNTEVATQLATQALEIADKPEIRNIYESIQLSLLSARALIARGDIKAAGKVLEPLWPQVAKADWKPLIAECAFQVGQLYKALSQGAPEPLRQKHAVRSAEFYLKAKGIWLELRELKQVQRVDQAIPTI